ncbi:MAG: fatty acid desaturase [Gemmatimonadales bacterium]
MTELHADTAESRPGDPYYPWRQTLLSTERVRELSVLRPWRAVADTFKGWFGIGLGWALVAWRPGPLTVALAVPLIGSSFYGLFILGHDGMHRRLFRNRRLNDLWNDVFCQGPIGAITHINNRNHLRHHQYLATGDDPDRHKHACFNKVEHGELLGFLSGIAGLVRTAANVFRPNQAARRRSEDETADGYTGRDVLLGLGVQAAIFAGLTAGIGWWAYPVLWLAPVYLFTYLADNFRSFAEHSQPHNDRASDRHRMITYRSNPVERWFVAPNNMNYHAAHHLWPSIPYYNLPIADREMQGHPDAATLEWRGSYLGYLWRYWRAQPIEECREPAAT